LGGLLADAARVAQLMGQGTWAGDPDLLEVLLKTAGIGLTGYLREPDLRAPADRRLAFRELGLAIGLTAVDRIENEARSAGVRAALEGCRRYAPVRAEIESFWLDPAHRRNPTWLGHEDINDVMLATSLLPEGFLSLAGAD
jgi:hypothetical protein